MFNAQNVDPIFYFIFYFLYSITKKLYIRKYQKKTTYNVYDAYNVKINTMEGWKGMHFATIFRRFYRNTFRLTNFCVKKTNKIE